MTGENREHRKEGYLTEIARHASPFRALKTVLRLCTFFNPQIRGFDGNSSRHSQTHGINRKRIALQVMLNDLRNLTLS